MAPVSGWPRSKQDAYADWKASLLANLGVQPVDHADGAVFYDFQPLAELAELRRAMYVGDGRRSQLGLSQAAHAAFTGDLVHGRRLLHRTGQGPSGTHQGGSGRIEICVAKRSRRAASGSGTSAGSHRLDADWSARGASQKAVLVFSKAETAKFHALCSVHAPVDGVQAAATVPGAVHGGTGLSSDAPGARPAAGCQGQAADPEHAPVRHRGGGITQLSRRRGRGSQQPEITPGGRALKFYSSIRFDIRRIESIKDGAEVIGNRTRVKVVKNKAAPPFKHGRVRHHVRQGDQPGRLPDRRGRRPRDHQEVRGLVHL